MKFEYHHVLAGMALAGAAQAAVVGPTGTLTVSNVMMSPDGVVREYVHLSLFFTYSAHPISAPP
jgi:hypothetical protein